MSAEAAIPFTNSQEFLGLLHEPVHQQRRYVFIGPNTRPPIAFLGGSNTWRSYGIKDQTVRRNVQNLQGHA